MRKLLLLSIVAISAILNGCQKDTLSTGETPNKGSSTICLDVTIGESVDSKSLASEDIGWINYKSDNNGMLSKLDHRVTLQIFTDSSSPYLTEVVMADPSTTEEVSSAISFADISLPVEQSYTAVVWVDFIRDGDAAIYNSTTTEPSSYDLWYSTSDLRSITMLNIDDGLVAPDSLLQESRDAYTTAVEFYVMEDGSWSVDGEDCSMDIISIEAIRPLSKMRILLDDYATREAWITYLTNSTRTLDYTAITVYGTPTQFNALSGRSITSSMEDLTFHTSWKDYAEDGQISTISWAIIDGEDIISSEDGNMPVVDICYLFPVDNSSNRVEVRMYDDQSATSEFNLSLAFATVGDSIDGWEVLSYREFGAIPIEPNQLTTIVGSFITSSYQFQINVDDSWVD